MSFVAVAGLFSLPVPVLFVLRPLHVKQSWQDMNEDPSDPRGHGVRLRSSKVDIENNHSHTNAAIKNLSV